MRIYLDSANLQDIAEAIQLGYVYGVTTNPTILQCAGVRASQVPELARRILDLGARELHLQVYAEDTATMIAQAQELVMLDPQRVIVKIPATPAGYAAVTQLTDQGIRVTLTAVYTIAQAVLAQSVGASYAAVYLGRLRERGLDALGLVGRMQALLRTQQAQVQILAASIRAPQEIEALAELGVATATMPLAIVRQLTESEGTTTAVAAFTAAALTLV